MKPCLVPNKQQGTQGFFWGGSKLKAVVCHVADSDSALKKFLDETAKLSADERAKHMEKHKVSHVKQNELQ